MGLTWNGGRRMGTAAPRNLTMRWGDWGRNWVLLLDTTCNSRQYILEISQVLNRNIFLWAHDNLPLPAGMLTPRLHPWFVNDCSPTTLWPVILCACTRSSNNGRHLVARRYGALTMLPIASWMALVFSFSVVSISWNNWANARRWGPWRQLSGPDSMSVRRGMRMWGNSGIL
jgi:hypothetical protein